MKAPDEVWIGQDEKDKKADDNYLNRWFYIKYYDGVAIVYVCKIQDGKLNFKSWYELYDDKVRKRLADIQEGIKAKRCSPYVRRPNSWFCHTWQIRVIRLDSGVCTFSSD